MAITLTQQKRYFPSASGLDPYLEWARATGFKYYFGRKVDLNANGLPAKARVPVILQLHDSTSAPRFAEEVRARGAQDWLAIPRIFADPPARLRDTKYCTAKVGETFLEEMRKDNSWVRRYVRRVGLCAPVRRGAAKAVHASSGISPAPAPKPVPPPPSANSSAKVVVGVIDDAIAFAHERFCTRKTASGATRLETRIEYFWCQDGIGTVPDGFDKGRELCKTDPPGGKGIDTWLKECTHAGLVDEDELYSRTRHIDYRTTDHKPLAWRRGHGTHVMDLACGFGPKDAKTAEAIPIIAVQLPMATTLDTSGATLEDNVLNALLYILKRTEDCIPGGNRLPIVVNLSYGLLAGPHDGSWNLERVIDEYITAYRDKLQVVLPSGNSHLARCHAEHEFDGTSACRSMRWRVQPEDYTPSYLEIWLPHAQDGPLDLEITIAAPGTVPLGPIKKGQTSDIERGGVIIGKVDYASPAPAGDRDRILVSLAPTATRDPSQVVAPSGEWHIEMKEDPSGSSIQSSVETSRIRKVHAWIRRDDAPYGYPRGARQSYFVDDEPNYVVYDYRGRLVEVDSGASYVLRKSSINAIATGKHAVVIGGCRRSDLASYPYSAGGPIVKPTAGGSAYRSGPDPDAMAASDDSPACHGVLAAGTRSGSTVAMGGTSVAAPQVTRWIAANIAAGTVPFGRNEVRTAARNQELPRPAPPATLYRDRMGDGRIDEPAIKPIVSRGRE
jgi:hypothetical protein